MAPDYSQDELDVVDFYLYAFNSMYSFDDVSNEQKEFSHYGYVFKLTFHIESKILI